MVGGLRCRQHRKFVGVIGPWKSTTIYNDATQGITVPTHILGERVYDDVGAEFDWFGQNWR